jgi:hypothetical protein
MLNKGHGHYNYTWQRANFALALVSSSAAKIKVVSASFSPKCISKCSKFGILFLVKSFSSSRVGISHK